MNWDKNLTKTLPNLFLVLMFISSFLIFPVNSIFAQDLNDWENNESANYDTWANYFPAPEPKLKDIKIDENFKSEEDTFDFPAIDTIHALTINATVKLDNKKSLLRVILVDKDLQEHLLYEAYHLLVNKNTLKLKKTCEETCVLDSLNPYKLRFDLIDASIHIDKLSFTDTSKLQKEEVKSLRKETKKAQDLEKIKIMNKNIKLNKMKWIAGETSVSKLMYEEKRKLFSNKKVPNLQGYEYYKGGVFEIVSQEESFSYSGDESSSLIEAFDWRNRHGSNNPNSQYYDGDPTGSGWITSITSQGCADCWAHCAIGATEAVTNLYFNQHLDINFGLDLSIQDVLSCSGAGSCNGGNPGSALNYISITGVVDENCFPYTASDQPCNYKCYDPDEVIRINGKEYISELNGEENIKRNLINHGPLTFGVISWWHCLVLVGFDKDPADGETIWTLKNSWGAGWGENGYEYRKVPLTDIYLVYAPTLPVTSEISSFQIVCCDRDGDGYYNWGISETIPSTCPEGIFYQKDCDDSDPTLGSYGSNGHCLRNSNSKVPYISSGGSHSLGVKSDNTVIATGRNDKGQCDVVNWENIVQVTANEDHTVGVKSDHTVVATGSNTSNQCDVEDWNDIFQVAAGYVHTVGLKSDGRVIGVGDNSVDQLAFSNWIDIVQVAAGQYHTVGLMTNGNVVAVGANWFGQTNVGGWSNIVQVAAGASSTVGLQSDGSVLAIGYNDSGSLNVSEWTDIVQVAAGPSHTVGLKSNGNVVAVGNNDFGQLEVNEWIDIVQVAAGNDYTLGLKSDGRIVAVGRNNFGQINIESWNLLPSYLKEDYDKDKDIDGVDLSEFISIFISGVSDVEAFATNFGKIY